MLDTSSSAEIPLFGTMAATPNIIIQRPLPTESYSWSDFPIAYQDDTTSSSSCGGYAYGYQTNCPASSIDGAFSSSHSSMASLASSSSSSMASSPPSHTHGFLSTHDKNTEQAIPQQLTSASPKRRNVRFSASTHVRTYSLVLGDHPLCGDGLAIELGWDYNETQQRDETEATATTEAFPYFTHVGGVRTCCPRRSYLSRKQLLLDVAGCTPQELDERMETRQKRAAAR